MRWVAGGAALAAGCRPAGREVVVYAAQDRVFAEPIFAAFERLHGVRVRALYDNEATKAAGLANRLIAESRRPRADVWWNNEEMRTRQLVARGVLERDWSAFGFRRRVLVARASSDGTSFGPAPARLATLIRPEWMGRVAMAYPVFGSTTAHFLALRQRWGEAAWSAWCTALAANRPLVVDGNSMVVRLVGSGQADVGLTDSDDVRFARREGLPVVEVPLAAEDGLVLPNTVARVVGARETGGARRLGAYLTSGEVTETLRREGALDPAEAGLPGEVTLDEAGWTALLEEFDPSLERLRTMFVR